MNGACVTGYDLLPDADLRMLEIRNLLIGLQELNLAERICAEYGVTARDLQLLARLEAVLRKTREENSGNSPDHNSRQE
ncbi:MAG: hypothetical protein VB050_03225 [Geobacteraceae bacterium]|nr:hypothetical protein [Geobacteraceae bacterium]